VIVLPPSPGAVKLTVMCSSPGATVGCAGADGTVLGITIADAGDAGPSPFAFVAVTVHVYDFPFVNAPTTIGDDGPEAEPGAPPFDDTQLAAKEVIALPPSKGAANDTAACASPDAATGCIGAEGTLLGTAIADGADGVPSPRPFVAVTAHVYDRPFVSEPTTRGDAAPDAVPAVPPFDDMQFAV
jgi:hypothetical protein